MEQTSHQDISIIDKDESTEKSCHVVDGFVIEDSKHPFPNGKLSFVPEEYGKPQLLPVPQTPLQGTPKTKSRTTPHHPPPGMPLGKLECEFCGNVGDGEYFLAPSRRFCSLTCCKRYSAEKRYYPYGRDEEGIAQSIREGLLNANRSSRGGSTKKEKRKLLCGDGTQLEETVGRGRRKSKRGGRGSISPLAPGRGNMEKSGSFLSSASTYCHPFGVPLHQWSMEDVGDFLTSLGFEAYVDRFIEHEIDGKALSLVKDHHLLMMLKLRLGPTLKICEQVSAIRNMEQYGTEDSPVQQY